MASIKPSVDGSPGGETALERAGPPTAMALELATAAVIGALVVFFFLLFLFVRRILTSFAEGYEERR